MWEVDHAEAFVPESFLVLWNVLLDFTEKALQACHLTGLEMNSVDLENGALQIHSPG